MEELTEEQRRLLSLCGRYGTLKRLTEHSGLTKSRVKKQTEWLIDNGYLRKEKVRAEWTRYNTKVWFYYRTDEST